MTDRPTTPGTDTGGEWVGHPAGSRAYRRILLALACAGVATFAQLYSTQAILPLIARDLGVDASDTALTVSAATIGLAIAVLGWSWVADRFGRVTTMKIALVAATACGLLVPLMPSFQLLVGVRALEGIALGGLPAVAVTYLHEEVDAAHAAVAAGTYVSGTTVGGLLGRLVAGPVAEQFGWRAGVGAVAVLAALAAVTFIVLLPTPRGFVRGQVREATTLQAVRANLASPQMLVLYGQAFLLMGGFVAVYNFLSFRLEAAPYSLPTTVSALLFLAYLAGTVSSRAAGSMAQRYGRSRVLVLSGTVMLAGVAATLAQPLPLVLVGLVVLTAGFFAAHSIASGWVGRRAVVGTSQAASLYNLFYYAGSSLFGWVAGLAFVDFGWTGTAALVMVLVALAVGWALLDGRDRARTS